MVENWSKDWTGWRTFFALMLKYWNHPFRTTATVSLATMRHPRACQAIDQPTLDIETISRMPRLLSSFRNLLLSMATSQWTLEIPCRRLHQFRLSMVTSFNKAFNSNKIITIPNQCNRGKRLSSTVRANHRSNHPVSTYSKVHPSSPRTMLFHPTICFTLL